MKPKNKHLNLFTQLSLIFLFINSFQSAAQTNVPIFSLEEIQSKSLHPFLFVYEDPSNKLGFQEVVKTKTQQKFKPFPGNQKLNAGSTYWGRVVIKNRLSWDTDWFLNIGGASFIECYIPDIKGQYTLKKSGIFRPGKEIAKVAFKRVGVPISLFSNSQAVIFFRLSSIDQSPPNFKVTLVIPMTAQTQYYQSNTLQNLIKGVFQGMLWIMLLYHFFIFLATLNRAYLLYAFYLLVIAIADLSEGQFLTGYLLDNHPKSAFYIRLIAGIQPDIIMYFLFCRYFLNAPLNAPLVNKIFSFWIVIRVVLLMIVLGILISSFNVYLANAIIYYTNAAEDLVVTLILALLFRVLPKILHLNLYMLGTLLLTLSRLITLIFNNINTLSHINWYFFSVAGSFLALLLFSLGVGLHIRLIEEKKRIAQEKTIRVQKEANEQLENKVKERTAEIEQQKEEIEAQRDNLVDLNKEISRQNRLVELNNFELTEKNELIQKQNETIEKEKAKSDELLLNILPEQTANELKEKGYATPQQYELVSVLFTDFKGFTKIAEKITPQEVIEELNYCFTAFDKILEKHNMEKIKTIGDAYMAAGGIPIANVTNPIDVIKAGLEMQQFMAQIKEEKAQKGEDMWEMRLGIHTGEIIAGVVGKKKFVYDIWGDTVNLAARMESSGEVGQVNISGETYDLIKDHFVCEYRGKIKAKNKGEVDMYFVKEVK